MAPLGVSFHLLIQDQGQVLSYLILTSLCCVLGLCHSFKTCALPLSLLLQVCPATGEWPGGLGWGLRRETLACVHLSVRSCASGPSRKKAHLHHSQNEYLIKSLCEAVGLLSPVGLFVTPWTAARQASLSFTISWSLLKLMSIESVMPSNHLILCRPLLPQPSIFPSIRVFSKE